jgi:hypothetical protein
VSNLYLVKFDLVHRHYGTGVTIEETRFQLVMAESPNEAEAKLTKYWEYKNIPYFEDYKVTNVEVLETIQ